MPKRAANAAVKTRPTSPPPDNGGDVGDGERDPQRESETAGRMTFCALCMGSSLDGIKSTVTLFDGPEAADRVMREVVSRIHGYGYAKGCIEVLADPATKDQAKRLLRLTVGKIQPPTHGHSGTALRSHLGRTRILAWPGS